MDSTKSRNRTVIDVHGSIISVSNAEFIRGALTQSQRLKEFNRIAIIQTKSLMGVKTLKKLTKGVEQEN